MIAKIIDYSLRNRALVLIVSVMVMGAGIYSALNIPIDAIPDLSDVQVIVYTEYPGQAPEVIEDQITYPLSSAMLAVPHARVVRGYSFFGFSLVYVIFEDGTDLYDARSRVLEYLNFATGRLPSGVRPQIGPDATGVGWVYMYVLSDPTGRNNLQELRSIQDWVLKYELASLDGVSEVASLGGFVKQYQVIVDPTRLINHEISLAHLRSQLARSNSDTGGRLIEMGETEYMVRGLGYIESTRDIEDVVLKVDGEGNPITIGDVAIVQIGPEIRRGIADWNGEGEVVAGIVVMRQGENTLEVIERVKQRLHEIQPSLPDGVEIRDGYDRSQLINRAVANVTWKLLEEMIVVAIVVAIFLRHARSALVAIVTLPVGVLASLLLMYVLEINANVMSLGGIAIAIGVMVDASIVLTENLHKHIEKTGSDAIVTQTADSAEQHRAKTALFLDTVRQAAVEVGPALFFSLLIIAVSFLPVLTLQEQSGRLFRPLALTKTFAMTFAAVIAITLIPVLMSWFVRGKTPTEAENPISRRLIGWYRPIIEYTLNRPRKILILSAVSVLLLIIPVYIGIPAPGGALKKPIGGEFMPPLNEGDILYMPTTLPGISITKARELLQQTDRLIMTVPEVKHVVGKIGRAETATDPAPLTMIETHIILKDRSEWRSGYTIEDIMAELRTTVQFPGLTNAWTYPIRTRIDMLSTGIKTPVGIKLMGDDLETLSQFGEKLEAIVRNIEGTASVQSERVTGGRYIDYEINRREAARYGLSVGDIQDTIMMAVGGQNVTYTVEGLARYPVNIRYPRELRDNLDRLHEIWIMTEKGAYIPISQVADIRVRNGPPMIKTENARRTAWILVDLKPGQDVASYVERAREVIDDHLVNKQLTVPPGVSITWSGQYEYLERAAQRFRIVLVLTVVVIALLLYMHFKNFTETLIILGTLIFAASGGVWLMWFFGYDRSIATDVGFIALMGLAAETGIVMLLYLDQTIERYAREGRLTSIGALRQAIIEGAVERVRPKVMTVATTFMGLVPILWATEAGSRVMKRLAVPMLGGLVTSTLLTLIIIPVIYELIQSYLWKRGRAGPFHRNADGEDIKDPE